MQSRVPPALFVERLMNASATTKWPAPEPAFAASLSYNA
jgi:hypothetical protein